MIEFYVHDTRQIESPGYDKALSRRDVYDWQFSESIKTLSDFYAYLDEGDPFESLIYWIYQGFRDTLDKKKQDEWASVEFTREDIEHWIHHVGEERFLKMIQTKFDNWLDADFPYDEIVYANSPCDGYSAAYAWFVTEDALCEKLSIDLIEGYHPGDDSQVAELMMSVDEANKICHQEDLGISFKQIQEEEITYEIDSEAVAIMEQKRKEFFDTHGMTENEWNMLQWEQTLEKLEGEHGDTIHAIFDTIDTLSQQEPNIKKSILWLEMLNKHLNCKEVILNSSS